MNTGIFKEQSLYFIFLFSLISFLMLIELPSAFGIEMAVTVDDLPGYSNLPPTTNHNNSNQLKNNSQNLSTKQSDHNLINTSFNTTWLDITQKYISVFKKHHITGVYGFVIGSAVNANPDGEKILKLWVDNGNMLGNHTYSHQNFDQKSLNWYENDIMKNEPYFLPLIGKNSQKYFRFPYLGEGNTLEKRENLRKFLFDHHYIIAEVSTNYGDWRWAEPYVRCVIKKNSSAINWLEKSYMQWALNSLKVAKSESQQVFHRDIKFILLIHLNAFNSLMLDQLLTAFEQQGVQFISLKEALSDPAYQIDPKYVKNPELPFLELLIEGRNLGYPPGVLAKSPYQDKLNNLCN